jgi:hypothetical protein
VAQAVIEFAVKPRAHGRQEDPGVGAAARRHRGHVKRGAGAVGSCLSLARTDLAAGCSGSIATSLGCGDIVP